MNWLDKDIHKEQYYLKLGREYFEKELYGGRIIYTKHREQAMECSNLEQAENLYRYLRLNDIYPDIEIKCDNNN